MCAIPNGGQAVALGTLSPCGTLWERVADPSATRIGRVRGLFTLSAVQRYPSPGASLRSAPPSPGQPRVFPGLAIQDWSKSETSDLDWERVSEYAARSLLDIPQCLSS